MISSAKCTTPGLGVQTRAKIIRAIGCLALIAACSSPPVDKSIVARVGEVDITFEGVLRFKGTMPALLLSEKEGVDALDEYLQSMIDMELLLLEAQPLAPDSSFAEKWAQTREKKLFEEFIKLEIQDKIDLSQEEIKRQWSESKWSRLLKLARIPLGHGRRSCASVAPARRGYPLCGVVRPASDPPPRGAAPRRGILLRAR